MFLEWPNNGTRYAHKSLEISPGNVDCRVCVKEDVEEDVDLSDGRTDGWSVDRFERSSDKIFE